MKIQILVGMIGSGKTYYAKQKAIEGTLCINDDLIVSMLHGGNYELYDKKLKSLYKGIEDYIIHQCVSLNRNVLIDRGLNISTKSRKRYISIAKSLDVECEAFYFENLGPEIHARDRFYSDNRGHNYTYWLRVAEHHNKQWKTPTIEEGFDSVIQIKRNQ